MSAVRCLCGGTLETVAATDGENSRTFTYHCAACNRDLALQLAIRDLGVRPRACGTDNGYRECRKRDGGPCDPCKRAHTAAVTDYRNGRKQQVTT